MLSECIKCSSQWSLRDAYVGEMTDPRTLPVRVVNIVLELIGLFCTVWRVYFRLKIGRFWWEDVWAVVAFLSCLVSLVGEWMFLFTHDLVSNVGFWLYNLGFPCVVRATHLSILFSIIRFVSDIQLRRLTSICAVFCGVSWIVIVSGKIWHCASDSSWHHYKYPACIMESHFLIVEFATNCITVAFLIALSLRVLWRLKLPQSQRRMIVSIFTSSTVLAFTAIFHVMGHFLNSRFILVSGIDLEIASSIIVCNLLVIVTCAYRFLFRDRHHSKATSESSDTESDDFTQRRQSMTLTTVELVDPSTLTTAQYTAESSV